MKSLFFRNSVMLVMTAFFAVALNAQTTLSVKDAQPRVVEEAGRHCGEKICSEHFTSENPGAQNVSLAKLTRGSIAYANNVFGTPANYIRFDVSDPLEREALSPNWTTMYGSEFYNGILYGFLTNGTFVKIDSPTGLLIEQIPGAGPSTNGQMQDMAYDYSEGIMYGVMASVLFTINLETGERTEVAPITGLTEGRIVLTLAIDLDGNMYGIESDNTTTANARFLQIDKETGETEFIGGTGRRANAAQSMAFDHNTGVLYWAQISSTVDANFMSIDPETGLATLIAETLNELCGLHFPYYEGGACPVVTDLEAEILPGNILKLTWTAAEGDPIGYVIFSGIEEVTTVTETEYISAAQNPGSQIFGVMAIFDEEEDDCIPAKVTIPILFDFLGTETLVYAYSIFGTPTGYVCFDVEDPAYRKVLAPTRAVYGADAFGAHLFGFLTNGNYVIIDQATSDLIEEIPFAFTSQMQDMSFDHSDGVFYGVMNNVLYSVDLWSGTTTMVAQISGLNEGENIMTLAVNLEGTMYAIGSNAENGRFLRINKTTGAATFIGNTGKGVVYAQGMTFDHDSGVLYWAQLSSTADLNFMSVNVATGVATAIYATGNEMVAVHIPYDSPDACPAVTNLEAEVLANGTDVLLTWTAASGNPTGYKVYSSYNELTTVTTTQYTVTNQPPGENIYWVEAIYSGDCIPYRMWVKADLPLKPNNPPRNVRVVQNGNCAVKITWNAPLPPTTEPGALETSESYKIYCNDVLITTLPSVYRFFDYEVSEAGTYTFCIVAVHTNGQESMSICRQFTPTCGDDVDLQVSGLTVDMDYVTREATLSWVAPTKVVWDNMNCLPTSTGTTIGYWSISDNAILAADDFFAPEAWTIEYLRTRAFVNPAAQWEDAKPEKFSVNIYQNSALNRPGAAIYTNNEITTFATSEVVATSVTATFLIKLPEPFTLPSAGVYWVSIIPAYDKDVQVPADVAPHRVNVYMGTAGGLGYSFCVKDEDALAYGAYPVTLDWFPYIEIIAGLTQTSIQFAIEKAYDIKYNVYMDGDLIAEKIDATSLKIEGIDISQDHLFCVTIVDANDSEGDAVCQAIEYYLCNAVGSAASVVIDDYCTEAVLTWPAAVGANTVGYRIIFDGDVIADDLPNTAEGRRYVHEMDFVKGQTYTWEIVTICEEAYSDPRVVTATAVCPLCIDENSFRVMIYPNPANASVTIEGENIVKIEIFNMSGQIIDTQIGNLKKVDVSGYEAGNYLFKVYDLSNNVVTKTITVTK